MNDDPIGMAKQMAQIVRDAVAQATGPLEARIKQLEERPEPDLGAIAALVQPAAPGKDGVSVSLDEITVAVLPMLEARVDAIPAPADGKSVTLPEVLAELRPHVDEVLAAIPVPKDGKNVTLEEAAELLEILMAKRAVDIERHAAGVLERAIDKMPKAKDGRDALDIEDFEMVIAEDGRTLTVRLKRGELVIEKSVRIPTMQYLGVHDETRSYERGDSVSWGGSTWMCEKDGISARPSDTGSGWRLLAKKGRDGTNGRNGIDMTKPVKLP
jgi:hypothetical protein